MRLGIFSKSIPGTDPSYVFSQCRAAGYSLVQFNWASTGLDPLPVEITDSTIQSVRTALMQSGVEVVAVSGTYNMIHPVEKFRNRGASGLREVIRTAALIGADCVTLCTGTRNPNDLWKADPQNLSSAAWIDLCKVLEPALVAAERARINLGIEPEPGNVVNSAKRALALIREMRSTCLKIVFDPANLVVGSEPKKWDDVIDDGLDILADQIVIAHAKDIHESGTITAAGKGIIDFWYFIAGLKKRGIRVPLITHGLTAEEAPAAFGFLKTITDEVWK